jgi:hypothetical protein
MWTHGYNGNNEQGSGDEKREEESENWKGGVNNTRKQQAMKG